MSLLSSFGLGFRLMFSSGGTVEGLDKVAKKTAQVSQGFRNIGIGINTIRGSVTGLGQIALAGTNAAKVATKGLLSDYLAWDDRIQQMGGTFGERFTDPMRRELRLLSQDFAMTFGILPSQAAAGMDAMAKAGLDSIEKMRAIGPAAFAISKHEGSMAPDEAARAMVQIASQFSMPIGDAAGMQLLADKIQTASDISLASVKDLMEALSASGVKLSETGTSVDEALALLSTMAQKGLKGAPAGHGLNRILTQLAIPRARKLSDALQWSALGPDGSMKDIIDIVSEISDMASKHGLDALDQIQVKTILMQTRGERAANAILGGGGRPAYEVALDQIVNAAGKLDDTMAIRGRSVKMQFDKIKASAMVAAAEIVDSYGPQIANALGSAIKWTGQLVEGLRRVSAGEALAGLDQSVQDFIKGMQKGIETAKGIWNELVAVFRKVEDALGPVAEKLGISVTAMVILGPILGPVITLLLMVVGAFASIVALGVGTIQVLLGLWQVGVGAFAGLKTASAWLMVNPFAAGLIGLAAIGLIFGEMDDWEAAVTSLGRAFQHLWNAVQPVAEGFMMVFGPILSFVGELVSEFFKQLASLTEGLAKMLDTIFNGAGGGVGKALGVLAAGLIFALTPAASFIVAVSSIILVLNALLGIVNMVVGAIQGLIDIFSGADIMKAFRIGAIGMAVESGSMSKADAVRALGAEIGGSSGRALDPGSDPNRPGMMQRLMDPSLMSPKSDQPTVKPKADTTSPTKTLGDAKGPWQPTFRFDLAVESNVKTDGKKIGGAVARHTMEVAERSGSKLTPWQRVQIIENGVTPRGA